MGEVETIGEDCNGPEILFRGLFDLVAMSVEGDGFSIRVVSAT